MKEGGRVSLALVLLVALGAGLLGGGAGVLLLRKAHEGAPPPSAVAETKPVSFLYSLGELTVNLREPGRYLRVGVELEVLAKAAPQASPPAKEETKGHGEGKEEVPLPPAALPCKAEMDQKRPKILDAVIEELSASSFPQLLTVRGKQDLRERIRKAVSRLLEGGEVQHVYFTSFLVQ